MPPATVKLEDVLVPAKAGIVHRTVHTTAHAKVARFYRQLLSPARRPSTLEVVASAPSPFAVEMAMRDFRMFAGSSADARTRARVERAAHVRVCQLRGVLPASTPDGR